MFASILTIIITSLLSFILYKNVLMEEALVKKILSEKAMRKKFQLKESYSFKIQKGYIKLKIILLICNACPKRKIKSLNIQIDLDFKNRRKEMMYNNYSIVHHYRSKNIKYLYDDPCKFNQINKGKEISQRKILNLRKIELKKFENIQKNNIARNSKNINTISKNVNNKTLNQSNNVKTYEKTERDILISNNFMFNNLPNEFNFNCSNLNLVNNKKTINAYQEKYLSIEQENFEIFAKKKLSRKFHNKVFIIKIRYYNFPTNSRCFSAFQISILNPTKLENLVNLLKSHIKTLFVISLYLYLWIYLMMFIQSIYKQYGKNIIKICVMPLISMLVIKLTITFNFMMFMTTIGLYYFGEYFIKKSKIPQIQKILFKAFVPQLAYNHYLALKGFLDFI